MTEPAGRNSWDARVSRRLTPNGSVIVPPRLAGWLERKAGITPDWRIAIRDTDPEAYEVLVALHLAALGQRSDRGTKTSAAQSDQKESTQWLTTSEAGNLIGVTDRCIRKRINTGRLPATRHGGRWLINRNDLRTHRHAA